MTEGSNQGLFVVVAIVIFGIFVSMVYLLFGDNLKPTLSSIFKDSFGNVNNVMGIDSSVDSSGGSSGDLSNLPYDDWVKALESKGYVVANDSDFEKDYFGNFRYIGTDKKVIIPKVIQGVTIKSTKSMFSYNSTIEAVAMKNPNVTDMTEMFNFNLAESLDLSSFETSNVTNMSGMFSSSQATKLNLSSFDTSNVTNMADMFNGSQATELKLSNFNTSNVTNMSQMFNGIQATSLDLSNFNTSKVTNMYAMFYNSQATELNLSSFDTSKVTDMARMFLGSEATELDLSSFDTSKVTNMASMFAESKATTGLARTSADADKFNNSSYKPSRLYFGLKQQ